MKNVVYHVSFSGYQPEELKLFTSITKAINWAKTEGVEYLLNEASEDYHMFEEITGLKVVIDDELEDEVVVKYYDIRDYDEDDEECLNRVPYETAYIKPVKVE